MRSIIRYLICAIVFPAAAMAQWHQLPGPYAGQAYGFASIAGSSTRIYAATENGVYRGTNAGAKWQLMGLKGRTVTKARQFLAANQEIILAIVQDTDAWRLCRSADSARTWDTIFTAYDPMLEIFQDGSDALLCIGAKDTTAGIYRTNDLGLHWIHQAGPASVAFLDFAQASTNILGIAGDSGLWVVPLHGSRWQKTDYSHDAYSAVISGLTWIIGGNGRVDVTTDNGVSWLAVPNIGLDSAQDLLQHLAVNGQTMIASGAHAYRTTDAGRSWQYIEGTGGYPRDFAAATVECLDNHFMSATRAGVVASTDGLTWSYASDGIIGGARDVIANDALLFAATGRGVFRSSDRGATWITPTKGSDLVDSLAERFVSLPSGIYAFGSLDRPSGLWRWQDTGWMTVTDLSVTSISEYNGVLCAGLGTNGVVTSTDNGATWHSPAFGVTFDTASTDAVMAGSKLFAFVRMLRSPGSKLYSSTDNGVTWSYMTDMSTTGSITNAVQLPNGTLLANSTDALLTSTNGGATWRSEPQHVRQLRLFASGAVATTLDSIYRLGSVRQPIITDSATGPLVAFAMDTVNAYALSMSRGIWASPLKTLPLSVNSGERASALKLRVYPNPAKDDATLEFDLVGSVSIRLYDERGSCRRVLFEGQASGETTLPLTLLNLPSGIYFIEVSSADAVGIERIVLQ